MAKSNSTQPQSSQASVTLVHEVPSYPKFTGTNIPVHILLKEVDDEIARRNITDDAVKIAHLKSRCELTKCLAGHLLQSDLFLTTTSYDEFKSKFIKYFSGSHKSGTLAPLSRLADSHKRQDHPLPVMEALQQASNVKLELIKQLESSEWVDKKGQVDLTAVGNLFGYYSFMFLLHPSTAKQASEKNFSFLPEDTLTEFASKFDDSHSLVFSSSTADSIVSSVSTQHRQHQPRSTSRSVPPGFAQRRFASNNNNRTHQSSNTGQRTWHRSPSTHSRHSHSGRSSSPHYCYYCKRKGHTIERCFQRQRHHPNQRDTYFCDYHGSCGHDTSACRTLASHNSSPPAQQTIP